MLGSSTSAKVYGSFAVNGGLVHLPFFFCCYFQTTQRLCLVNARSAGGRLSRLQQCVFGLNCTTLSSVDCLFVLLPALIVGLLASTVVRSAEAQAFSRLGFVFSSALQLRLGIRAQLGVQLRVLKLQRLDRCFDCGLCR